MSRNPMIDPARVAHRDVVTEQGAGVQHFAVCPDGYLVECGGGDAGFKRARAIMNAVNAWLKAQNRNIVTEWPPEAMPF